MVCWNLDDFALFAKERFWDRRCEESVRFTFKSTLYRSGVLVLVLHTATCKAFRLGPMLYSADLLVGERPAGTGQ